MLAFSRDDWTLEVEPRTWADILDFLATYGWQPNVPAHRIPFVEELTVGSEDAVALAAAGRVVLEETMKDPLAAYSNITFDMGKFAEIVEFASEGQFTITQRE